MEIKGQCQVCKAEPTLPAPSEKFCFVVTEDMHQRKGTLLVTSQRGPSGLLNLCRLLTACS